MSRGREDGSPWGYFNSRPLLSASPFATQPSLFLNHDRGHYITLTAAITAIMTTEVPYLRAQGSHFNPNRDLFLNCNVAEPKRTLTAVIILKNYSAVLKSCQSCCVYICIAVGMCVCVSAIYLDGPSHQQTSHTLTMESLRNRGYHTEQSEDFGDALFGQCKRCKQYF